MPVVWSDRHRLHEPGGEIWVGVRTPGTEVPERAERIRAELEAAGAPLLDAGEHADRRAARASTTPRSLDYLATRLGATGRRPGLTDGSRARTGSSRTSSPTPACSAALTPREPARSDRRAGRALRLRHDDPDRAGHLGGGARRRRRRADRRRPRRSTASAPPTRCCRPPGHHATRAALRRLVLPQQRGRAAAAACATRSTGRSPCSTSTPTTATARSRSSTTTAAC